MATSSISTRRPWLAPTGLILLSVVPVAAGTVRLVQLFGGADITPENARFFAAPIPIVLHIPCVTVYAILGAFQFVPGIRRRHPRWHRVAGRILIPCGLVVALSGLWMTLFYPLPANDSALLNLFRIVVSVGITGSLVLGFSAIRRRDIVAHRAWMMRGYALAMGAGTQALTGGPWLLLVGTPGGFTRALLMGAGWLINIVLAEWIIRRGMEPVGRLVRRSP